MTLGYQQIEEIVPQLPVSGTSMRIDCVFCGGRKTLSITKKDGTLLWHCFHANCAVRGAKDLGRTTAEIRSRLKSGQNKPLPRNFIPSLTSDCHRHPRVMRYLADNHCLAAYEDKAVKIRYCPASDRVLFYTSGQEGAVGRALRKVRPKWKVYGELSSLFQVGNHDVAVLVEDAASACSVYATGQYTGVALLGTNLSLKQKKLIRGFSKIIIALDKDASKKALRMCGELRGVTQTSVKFLERDLKYLSAKDVRKVFSHES